LRVKIAKLKSKDYIENGAQIQGANYSLNEGLSCKRFKHLRAKMQMDISHLKTAPFQGTLFIFFKQETDTA
jgi:hypothetical protein